MDEKNGTLAMVISFIFTGLGLAYLGEIKKGLILFGAAVVLNCMGMWTTSLFSYISIALWIYGLYATYLKTKEI